MPNTQLRALVIEDEPDIRSLISMLLTRLDLVVEAFSDAESALERLKSTHFDLMVVDWMLPKMSGLDFVKSMAQSNGLRPPIVMLTAKGDVSDIVAGLSDGADEYITKPFNNSVFQARITALLRRTTPPAKVSRTLEESGLVINLDSFAVQLNGQDLSLTISEFKILVELMQNRGVAYSREQLIRLVQGEGVNVTGRTIDTHVFGIRKKLGNQGAMIEAIRGFGYMIKPKN